MYTEAGLRGGDTHTIAVSSPHSFGAVLRSTKIAQYDFTHVKVLTSQSNGCSAEFGTHHRIDFGDVWCRSKVEDDATVREIDSICGHEYCDTPWHAHRGLLHRTFVSDSNMAGHSAPISKATSELW